MNFAGGERERALGGGKRVSSAEQLRLVRESGRSGGNLQRKAVVGEVGRW